MQFVDDVSELELQQAGTTKARLFEQSAVADELDWIRQLSPVGCTFKDDEVGLLVYAVTDPEALP